MVSYLGVVRTIMMADTSQFNLAIRNASSEFRTTALDMQRSARGLIGVGGALNLAITAPLLLATRAVVKFGAEYESAMLKVKQVSEMSNRDFQQFAKDQLALSKEMKTRPSDLAKIAYMGAQAQITDPKRLKEFQKAVTMAQTIAPGDASAEIVSEALARNVNAFKRSCDQIIDTVAQMKFATDKGQISWHQYATTIGHVAAQAANITAGDRFKDLNLAMALITQGGVSGQTAAVALRGVYDRIYDEGKKESSLMNRIGRKSGFAGIVDMYERGFGGDLPAMMQALGRAGYGTTEKGKMLGFGRRETGAALALMNAPIQRVAEFRSAYDVATKEFIRKFEEAQNTTTKGMEAVAGAMERLKLAFFDTFSTSIADLINQVADFISKLAELPESTKKMMVLVTALASLGAVLTGLLGVIKSLTFLTHLHGLASAAGAGAGVLPAGEAVAQTLARNAPGMGAMEFSQKAWEFRGNRLQRAVDWGWAVNPRTGGRLATMRGATSQVSMPFVASNEVAMRGMQGVMEGMMNPFKSMFTMLFAPLKGTLTSLGTAILGMLKGFELFLGKIVMFAGLLVKVAAVATVVVGIFKAIQKIIPAMPFESLKMNFGALRDLFNEVTDVIADALAPVLINVFGWLVDAVMMLGAIVKKAFLGIVKGFTYVKHKIGRFLNWVLGDDSAVVADMDKKRKEEKDFIKDMYNNATWGGDSAAALVGGEGFRTKWLENFRKDDPIKGKKGPSQNWFSKMWDKTISAWNSVMNHLINNVKIAAVGVEEEIASRVSAGSSGFFEARTAAGYEAQMKGRDDMLSALDRLEDAVKEAARKAEEQREEMREALIIDPQRFTTETSGL